MSNDKKTSQTQQQQSDCQQVTRAIQKGTLSRKVKRSVSCKAIRNSSTRESAYMYTIVIQDNTNSRTFTKVFDSPYLYKKFLKKLQYSKKLKLKGTYKG